MKECIVCKKDFETNRKDKIYCSDFCKNRRNREPRIGNIEKVCGWCGSNFMAKKPWAKWCSKLCASRGRNNGLSEKISYVSKTREYVLGEANCLNCATTFIKKNKDHKFCRSECKTEFRNQFSKIQTQNNLPTIVCNECGITCKPVRKDGTTCGKRNCVDESRRKTKISNNAKACKKGGHRYEQYRKTQNRAQKAWKREKYDNDPKYNLTIRIRSSLRNSLKGIKKNAPTFDLLGYSVEELHSHIESFFTENGYSWENMNEWHIDHIRPVASFDFDSTDHPDFKKCWSLNNLQPLWAADNIAKGDKWDGIINA